MRRKVREVGIRRHYLFLFVSATGESVPTFNLFYYACLLAEETPVLLSVSQACFKHFTNTKIITNILMYRYTQLIVCRPRSPRPFLKQQVYLFCLPPSLCWGSPSQHVCAQVHTAHSFILSFTKELLSTC